MINERGKELTARNGEEGQTNGKKSYSQLSYARKEKVSVEKDGTAIMC